MQSSIDSKVASPGVAIQQAASLDPIERSKEAWATAFAEAVFEQLPVFHDQESTNASSLTTDPTAARSQTEQGKLELARGSSVASASKAPSSAPLSRLSTEVQVGHLGKVGVQVTRSPNGLNIVIVVAEPHVKSLLESDMHVLLGNLRNAGLSVNSVRIDKDLQAGTSLALDRERPKGTSFQRPAQSRLKAYRGLEQDEEQDDNNESISLTV